MSSSSQEKLERNFTFPELVSKHLVCTICQEIFDNPFRLFCGHTYCKQCIDQWKKKNNTCPVCRIKFDQNNSSKDLIAFNIINDLEVLCNNKGCPWRGCLADLNQHFNVCLMDEKKMPALVKLKNNSKNKNAGSSLLEEHVNANEGVMRSSQHLLNKKNNFARNTNMNKEREFKIFNLNSTVSNYNKNPQINANGLNPNPPNRNNHSNINQSTNNNINQNQVPKKEVKSILKQPKANKNVKNKEVTQKNKSNTNVNVNANTNQTNSNTNNNLNNISSAKTGVIQNNIFKHAIVSSNSNIASNNIANVSTNKNTVTNKVATSNNLSQMASQPNQISQPSQGNNNIPQNNQFMSDRDLIKFYLNNEDKHLEYALMLSQKTYEAEEKFRNAVKRLIPYPPSNENPTQSKKMKK